MKSATGFPPNGFSMLKSQYEPDHFERISGIIGSWIYVNIPASDSSLIPPRFSFLSFNAAASEFEKDEISSFLKFATVWSANKDTTYDVVPDPRHEQSLHSL